MTVVLVQLLYQKLSLNVLVFCNKILPKIILIISDDPLPCQKLLLKHLVIACEFQFWREVSHVAPVMWTTGCCVDCLTGRTDGLMIGVHLGHWLTGLISASGLGDIDNCTRADGSNYRY